MNTKSPPPNYQPQVPTANTPRPGPPVDLTNTPVSMPASSPAQLQYQQKLAQSRASNPVGGGPRMSIAQGQGAAHAAAAGGIVQPDRPFVEEQPMYDISMDDLLPPEAARDPMFLTGHGAMFAINQPELARKYGIVRNNALIPGKYLRISPGLASPATQNEPLPVGQDGKAKLRQSTMDGLSALAQVQQTHAKPAEDGQEEEKTESPTVEATRSSKTEKQRALENLDDIAIAQFVDSLRQDELNNPEQRKIIESRLVPLKVEVLIAEGYVTQRVPIIPGVLEPVFRSATASLDLSLKRMLMEEVAQLRVTENYYNDKFALMSLTAGLESIVANNPLPGELFDEKGILIPANFWQRFNIVSKNSFWLVAALHNNYRWFEERVRKLFRAELIKNG